LLSTYITCYVSLRESKTVDVRSRKDRPNYSVVQKALSIILYLSFTYLTFYVYFYFFMLLSNDRTTSCSKSWDRYHFGNTGISVDFYVYVPINTYRRVEEQFFYIFIAVLRLFEKKNSICRTYVLYPIIFCRTYWNFAGPEFTKF
jgi:hypothetical protein